MPGPWADVVKGAIGPLRKGRGDSADVLARVGLDLHGQCERLLALFRLDVLESPNAGLGVEAPKHLTRGAQGADCARFIARTGERPGGAQRIGRALGAHARDEVDRIAGPIEQACVRAGGVRRGRIIERRDTLEPDGGPAADGEQALGILRYGVRHGPVVDPMDHDHGVDEIGQLDQRLGPHTPGDTGDPRDQAWE